jgi:hypothetical protein
LASKRDRGDVVAKVVGIGVKIVPGILIEKSIIGK